MNLTRRLPWQEWQSLWAEQRFLQSERKYSQPHPGSLKNKLTNFIVFLVNVAAGEGIVLSGFPSLPGVRVIEDGVPSTTGLGPVVRAFETARRLEYSQVSDHLYNGGTYIAQTRTVDGSVVWAVLIWSWPGPGGSPGSIRAVVPGLDALVGLANVDGTGKGWHDGSSQGKKNSE